MKAQNPNTTYTPGCTLSNNDLYDPANECATEAGFPAAVAAANAADQVVLALGETREMSGEAESRSMLDLPGKQEELIKAIKDTGKPFAVVLFNGRPLVLDEVQANSPSILEAWFGGVEGANGVADALYGKVNPGGKLPVSFPRNEGQVPIYYNHKPTGRPCDPNSKYNSRHRDILSLHAAVRVRLRAQLHHVQDLQPAPELGDHGCPPRTRHGERGRHEHRPAGG